jgi:hypothetical protein
VDEMTPFVTVVFKAEETQTAALEARKSKLMTNFAK